MIETLLLLAQDAPPAPDAAQLGADAINALIPVAVPLLIWGMKTLVPKLPKQSLPMIALGLGVAADWVIAFAAGGDFTPIVGALLGLAGVGLREATKHLKPAKPPA